MCCVCTKAINHSEGSVGGLLFDTMAIGLWCQGSVFPPVLFNIYVKPLGEDIQSFQVYYHQYADDIHLSFPSNSKEAALVLNQCLVSVTGWMRVNKLKLNPGKTEVLLVNLKADEGIGMQPVLDRVIYPLKKQVCGWGVVL